MVNRLSLKGKPVCFSLSSHSTCALSVCLLFSSPLVRSFDHLPVQYFYLFEGAYFTTRDYLIATSIMH